ncbi:MAG TPA: glycosyltransferase family 39 protein [Chitinophagales bacterium]|nr:glycosyltransferase family 39 protein [Chitinophagales bacterium]
MKFSLPGESSRTKSICLWIVLVLASFLSFWKLGDHPLFEWDESRYAVYAYEMIQHHDYVNYYFYDKIDPTVSKPPLYLWAITVGYRIFGYNEFAIRFFSALAAVLFFFIFFQWVSLYKNYKIAFFSCMVLMSCKAVIGYHQARTGDMDSFLMLFSYLSLYYFSHYVDFEKKRSIIWSGIFLGFAFLSKGTVAFLLAPSLLVYMLLRKKLLAALIDFHFWLGAALFILVAGSWYVLVMIFGIPFHDPVSEANNNWQQLLHYNIVYRLTHPGVGGEMSSAHNYFFYAETLDSRFNLWNYLFYTTTILFIVVNFKRLKSYFKNPFYLLLFICITVTTLILTVSLTKLDWWYTSGIPMIAVLLIMLIESVSKKFPFVKFISVGLFAFTLVRQFIFFNQSSDGRGKLFRDNKNLFQDASTAYWYRTQNEQDLFTYFDWYSKKIGWLDDENLQAFTSDSSSVLFGRADEYLTNYLTLHHELKFQKKENYYLVYH